MSETNVPCEDWVYDSIPQYRLNVKIIDGFLSKKWPGYDFHTEVS